MAGPIKELWKKCYTGYVYRPWLNKYVSKVSIYVTWFLVHTPITADQVTISEYFLLFLGAIFLFFGRLEYIFIGLLIIQFTNLLDCVDGEIARYRKKPSLTGVHLEDIYHALVPYFMFFPLAFGIFLQTGWKSMLIFGFLCSIFSKSVIIPAMESAVIKSRMSKATPLGYLKKDRKSIKEVNLQGSELGKQLNDSYDKFKDFWAWPTNMLHLTIISFLELINKKYQLVQSYSIFYWYIVLYSVIVILIQIVSFIVHYKGKAAEQYYKKLFGNS